MSRIAEFDSPNDLYLYVVATIQMLEASSLPEAAHKLEAVNAIFYTTGSEWLGELGLVIRSLEEEYSIPQVVQERLDAIMSKVTHT